MIIYNELVTYSCNSCVEWVRIQNMVGMNKLYINSFLWQVFDGGVIGGDGEMER